MQNKIIEPTLFTIKPLHDTWDVRADTGVWVINLPSDFTSWSSQQINAWYKQTFISTVEAFSELIKVWEVALISTDEENKRVVINWNIGDSYEEYIQNISQKILEFPAIIHTLEIQADFNVFVRTNESPEKIIRGWVRYLGKFYFCGHTFSGKPYIYLDMDHTLFCPSSSYEDNTELYDLNQPLLEKALRNWEQKIGTINEYDGLEGIYEYGFLPDE